jgi:trehalose 6-phosphate synthase/phosphatase
VVELRPHGANKGRTATEVLAAAPKGALVVAFGDDVTDEDLFAALPESALTFHVGPGPSKARFRLRAVADVLAMIAAIDE